MALALLGIVLAHTGNNLMNDLSDTEVGLDTDAYPRALYAPHPFLSGLVTRRQLLVAVLAINVADLVDHARAVRGARLAGGGLRAGRAVPVLRLHRAAAAAEEDRAGRAGRVPHLGPADGRGHLLLRGRGAAVAGVGRAVPYGLLCTTVLMGKHIDKIPYDEPAGTRTLPVLLGEPRARAVDAGLLVGFYVTTVRRGARRRAALAGPAGGAGAADRLAQGAGRPSAPAARSEPPPGFPVWPLWFAAIGFVHVTPRGRAARARPGARRGHRRRPPARRLSVLDLLVSLVAALVLAGAGLAVLVALTRRAVRAGRDARREVAARPVPVGRRRSRCARSAAWPARCSRCAPAGRCPSWRWPPPPAGSGRALARQRVSSTR